NHPPRNVYSITPLGKERFHELLQQLVVQVDPQSSSADIAITFLDHLQPGEVISLLRKRLSDLRSNLIQLEKTPRHANARGVDLAVSRKLALLRAEEEWLRRTIAELELSSKRSEQS